MNEIEIQCKKLKCPHFIQWFYYQTNYSCNLIGESDHIEEIPINCSLKDKILKK
jgi:hypothetical protein